MHAPVICYFPRALPWWCYWSADYHNKAAGPVCSSVLTQDFVLDPTSANEFQPVPRPSSQQYPFLARYEFLITISIGLPGILTRGLTQESRPIYVPDIHTGVVRALHIKHGGPDRVFATITVLIWWAFKSISKFSEH